MLSIDRSTQTDRHDTYTYTHIYTHMHIHMYTCIATGSNCTRFT